MSRHRAEADGADLDRVQLRITGNASDDDVAAVLATLRELATRVPPEDGYPHWRRTRLAALGRTPPA